MAQSYPWDSQMTVKRKKRARINMKMTQLYGSGVGLL